MITVAIVLSALALLLGVICIRLIVRLREVVEEIIKTLNYLRSIVEFLQEKDRAINKTRDNE